MDADEKLLALKKAFADIILNISKEAAARVMDSERKAARYQHELRMAKEEGTRMLVRLKRMMDSEISEAKEASFKKQQKMEELEAQLNEAEDIVKDLREELREVQAELEGVKNDKSQLENEPDGFRLRDIPVENKNYPYKSSAVLLPRPPDEFAVASDRTSPYPRQENKCDKCHDKVVCLCRSYTENRDLPNIILKGKTPGLYRNGCTQRIRACERNVLNKGLSLSGVIDKVKEKKNCTELEEGKDTCEEPTSGAESLKEHKEEVSGAKPRNFESYTQKRKRNYRRKKIITPFFGKSPVRFPETDQFPELSVKTGTVSIEDSTHLYSTSSKITPNISTHKDEPQQPELQDAESSEKATSLVEEGHVTNVQKGAESIGGMVVTGKETGFAETCLSPGREMDAENTNIPLSNPDIKSCDVTKAFSTHTIGERIIKYTFQRKRKRQSLSDSNANVSLELERKVDPPRHSLSTETSRDNRRLAQVAHQLISLSEKKWCQ